MLHLDEGVVHELLDGELDLAEAETVRRHIAECGDCLRLYQEAATWSRKPTGSSPRSITSLPS